MEITLANLRRAFREDGYITDEEVLLTVFNFKLQKPLIEGEPGVGKTELAKVLAIFRTTLIRLRYEADENKALYEWNYQKQLLKFGCPKMQLSL